MISRRFFLGPPGEREMCGWGGVNQLAGDFQPPKASTGAEEGDALDGPASPSSSRLEPCSFSFSFCSFLAVAEHMHLTLTAFDLRTSRQCSQFFNGRPFLATSCRCWKPEEAERVSARELLASERGAWKRGTNVERTCAERPRVEVGQHRPPP